MLVPILPGKKDALLAFANAMMNERKADLDKAQVTVTKESWHFLETPHGDFLIVYFEAPDGGKVHAALAASQEPFDIWFRAQVLDCTGIDISTPPSAEALPTKIFNWSRG